MTTVSCQLIPCLPPLHPFFSGRTDLFPDETFDETQVALLVCWGRWVLSLPVEDDAYSIFGRIRFKGWR